MREIKERQQKWMNEKKEFDGGKPCNSTPCNSTPARQSDNNRKLMNTPSQHQLLHTSPPGHSDILEQISPERNHVEKWLQHNSTPVNPSTVSSYKPSNTMHIIEPVIAHIVSLTILVLTVYGVAL